MDATTPHALNREIEAARLIADHVRGVLSAQEYADAEGDQKVLLTALDGETSFLEAVEATVRLIGEDEARIEGLKAYAGALDLRRKRFEKRVDSLRAILVNALDVAGQAKLETAVATISLKPVPPKLQVVEEADIPPRFWITGDPKLDRKALTDALKARAAAVRAALALADPEERRLALSRAIEAHPEIPGADLSNGSMTVAIRKG